jgi:hypothetical protein
MNSDEIYSSWKEQKSQIDIREDFADEVMNQICQYERERRKPLFYGHRLIELISAHRPAKAGVVIAGAAAGLVRIMFVVYVYLWC